MGGGKERRLRLPSARSLAHSRPPPRPKPSPASTGLAPHCRYPLAAQCWAASLAAPQVPSVPGRQPRAFAVPGGPSPAPTHRASRAKSLHRRGGGAEGGRWLRRSPGRSRMRQDKLSSSLRRGGKCLKRQGGGGGVGTILSNVLKKRSCISRTAPRLLCTLEPGEDPRQRRTRWTSSVPASPSAVLRGRAASSEP